MLAVGLASCDISRPDPLKEVSFGDSPLLYVSNQNDATVSIIDMETHEVVETVDLQEHGFSSNARPHHIEVAADGAYWYVSLISENIIAKFSRANKLVGAATFESPGMLDLHPDDELLYVSHTMSIVDVPSTVAALRTEDMEVIEEVNVLLQRPHGMIVHPGGSYAYTASLSSNQLATINTRTQEAEIVTQDGALMRFVHFAPSPDGSRMYVTGQQAGVVQVLDVSDPASPRAIDSIAVAAGPWHPVYTPDGAYVYVPNKSADAVTVIDARTRSVAAVIEHAALQKPHGSATSEDGRFVYISNNGDQQTASTVVVIDTRTLEVVEVIDVGTYPTGIGNAY